MMKLIGKPFGYILATVRLLLLIFCLFTYLICLLSTVLFVSRKKVYARWWKSFFCQTTLIILGIRVKAHFEEALPQSYLLVSNHHSFIDPVVTIAVTAAKPVAKAEIKNYPLIGFGATFTGIVWVDRKDKGSRLAARNAIEHSLRNGDKVLVYPEGTLSPSPTTLRTFKMGAFKSAESAGRAIIPHAIKYHHPAAFWPTNRGMVSHFFHQFSPVFQRVDIYYGKKLVGDALENQRQAYHWMAEKLTE